MELSTKYRYVDRGLFDRVQFLMRNNGLDKKTEQNMKNTICLMDISASASNKTKFTDNLKKIEKLLLKKSKYTLVVRNLPAYAIDQRSRLPVPVSYETIRDTMGQFGEVTSLFMKYGVGYIEMSNSVYTHEILNKMQIGENIISTEVVS